MTIRYAPHLLALLLASSALIGCSSGGGGSDTPTPTYTVSGSVVGTGGAIAPDSQTVAKDATAIFELTPEANYVIDTVTGCGDTGTVSGNTYTTGPVTADCALEATFKLTSYTVSATATPGGTISVANNPVTYNDSTTLTVTPATDYLIDSVTGCGATLTTDTATVDTYTTTAVTIDCTVKATFILDGAATPVVLGYDIKQLTFTWPAVSGATAYKLMKDPSGASGYNTQVGADLTTTSAIDDIAVHLQDWPNASYMVQACNDIGCVDSNEVNTISSPDAYANALNAIGYVKAPTPAASDFFGTSVAVSGDGNTLAVGAPDNYWLAGATGQAGGVHLYSRGSGSWVHQAYLLAPNGDADDFFGGAVALSDDGNTLAVGAPREDSADALNPEDDLAGDAGAVYLFTRNGDVWGAPVYLKGGTIGGDYNFGFSLDLSGDGNTLAVGTFGEDAAYLFSRTGDIWGAPVRIIGADTIAGDEFGETVALSGDGSILAVGAPDQTFSGAVYAFSRNTDGSWSETALLKAPTPIISSRFGDEVALSDNGTTLAVGELGGDGTVSDAGLAYVFSRNADAWNPSPVVLEASNPDTDDRFGLALALSADGTSLVVGARSESGSATGINGTDDNGLTASGAAYVFTLGGAGWVQQSYVKASTLDSYDVFGSSVALSGDGATLAVGAEWERSSAGVLCAAGEAECGTAQINNDYLDAGAVYLY